MAKLIILIGGPSGAGKSTFARELIAQGLATRSFDFKAMPAKLPEESCIVEISTNKWAKTTASHTWSELLRQLPEFESIHCVRICIGPRELAKRYLKRLVQEKSALQLLKPRPWLHGLNYLRPGKVTACNEAWYDFERYLISRYSNRLKVLRIHVRGDNAAQGKRQEAHKPASA